MSEVSRSGGKGDLNHMLRKPTKVCGENNFHRLHIIQKTLMAYRDRVQLECHENLMNGN